MEKTAWPPLLKEYLFAVFGNAVSQLAGAVGVILALISVFYPTYIRAAGIGLIVVAVLIGHFVAWYDQRGQAEAARADLKILYRRALYLHSVEFAYEPDRVQLSLRLRNFGPVTETYAVQSLDCVLNGVSSGNLQTSRGAEIAPGSEGVFVLPVVRPLDLSRRISGRLSFVLQYGPADGSFSRQMTKQLAVTLLPRTEGPRLTYIVEAEKDEPIAAFST